MKKLALTIALISTMALGANAQSGRYDSFYNGWEDDFRETDNTFAFVLPTAHGLNDDGNGTPLGSGLWILTAIGVGYAFKNRKK